MSNQSTITADKGEGMQFVSECADNSSQELQQKRRKKHGHEGKMKKAHNQVCVENETKNMEENLHTIRKATHDLNQDFYPISHYISNKGEMLDHMFATLGWKQVRSMLPEQLKESTSGEIRELALQELMSMPEEQIMYILEGHHLKTSSALENEEPNVCSRSQTGSASTSWSDYDDANVKTIEEEESNICPGKIEPSGNKEISSNEVREICNEDKEISSNEDNKEVSSNVDNEISNVDKGISEIKETGSCKNNNETDTACVEQKSDGDSDLDTLEIGISSEEIEKILQDTPSKKLCEENEMVICESSSDKEKEKTLLEILELEMRARAIRALLKQQNEDSDLENQSEPDTSQRVSDDQPSVKHLHKKHKKNDTSNNSSASEIQNMGKQTEQNTTSHGNTCNELPQNTTGTQMNFKRIKLSYKKRSILESSIDKSVQLEDESKTKCTSDAHSDTPDNTVCSKKHSRLPTLNIAIQVNKGEEKNKCPIEKEQALQEKGDGTWASRWLQSKDVQKVVSTSRMCTKIRKRMRSAQKQKQIIDDSDLQTQITGSVSEYETLARASK